MQRQVYEKFIRSKSTVAQMRAADMDLAGAGSGGGMSTTLAAITNLKKLCNRKLFS